MPCCIHVRRVAIQALPDHQHRFTVALPAAAEYGDIRGEGYVLCGNLLPDELKLIASQPHVLAAAGDRVTLGIGIVFRRARMQHIPHIVVAFEYADRSRSSLSCRSAG